MKVFGATALLAVAAAAPSNSYAPKQAYSHGPRYHQPSYKEPDHYDTPYQFDYAHVKYVADRDGHGGYNAEVTYSGEPHYEEHKPSYHPAPAYKLITIICGLITAALLAVAAAAHAKSYAPKPAYSHGPSYHQPSYNETDH
ncbi:uncharacterized protein LOC119097482 [Pollicipes pollicipes]|uniref:uncharacterized protein LOC119097482 n=1 Tax=Pollicipes pollicipes TaxID=41117 RepID=UPI00188505DD|nr:uncharacterized protein LOC119097482 [Pollicipes pollicipes]